MVIVQTQAFCFSGEAGEKFARAAGISFKGGDFALVAAFSQFF
ncbi:hypothetical protein [Lactobacillus delbrueckii]|nr:hypothetical protein [Lactobacillus delbrueckii]CDR76881.1 Putative uncharacterized protein [Lactobacillus delbrueckii subsp. lactis]CDR81311.1 Protein of unknown function [Lactobacillus delbrueckii subsp. lactis]